MNISGRIKPPPTAVFSVVDPYRMASTYLTIRRFARPFAYLCNLHRSIFLQPAVSGEDVEQITASVEERMGEGDAELLF